MQYFCILNIYKIFLNKEFNGFTINILKIYLTLKIQHEYNNRLNYQGSKMNTILHLMRIEIMLQ